MSRVTRSRAIQIAEDDVDIATQVPLPSTPMTYSAPLTEISFNVVESVTVDEVELEQELKGLKAAYKTALGVKKSKKGKGKNMDNLAVISAENSRAGMRDRQVIAPSGEDAHQTIHSSEQKTLTHLLSNNSQTVSEKRTRSILSPAICTTGQSLANTQPGQSDIDSSVTNLQSFFTRPNFNLASAVNAPSFQPSLSSWVSGGYQTSIVHCTDTVVGLAEGSSTEPGEMRQDKPDDLSTLSPSKKMLTLEEVERHCVDKEVASNNENVTEDSFVEQISARSPAKPVSRIEDSVEELDRLEEAMQVVEEIALAQNIAPSPEKTRTNWKTRATSPTSRPKMADKTISAAARTRVKPTQPFKSATLGRSTINPTLLATKPAVLKKVRSASSLASPSTMAAAPEATKPVVATTKRFKRPTSLLPPKVAPKSSKPVTRPTFELPGEAIARKLKEQREARIAQRTSPTEQPVKATIPRQASFKSTKAPTKPTFELPGEALSRRKREAHESRIKAQEEEERKRREFRAKPVRQSSASGTIPRDTITSRARKSIVGVPQAEDPAVGKLYGSLGRGSTVGAHRPSILAMNLANSSAPRTRPFLANTSRKVATQASGPRMSGASMQRTSSAGARPSLTGIVGTQKAKEIYNRGMRSQEDAEAERREREAAAKRSREEAAERGRQASREWAERQKAKKASQADTGLAAGFGPGGQMGLKA